MSKNPEADSCEFKGCSFMPTTKIRISSSMGHEDIWVCDFHAENLFEAQERVET